MNRPPPHVPHNDNTVILAPRRGGSGTHASRHDGGMPRARATPNASVAPSYVPDGTHIYGAPNPASLVVRFGIDSLLGRAVARTLVWLLLLQPVYVAFGMELTDEQTSAGSAEETAISDDTAVEEFDTDGAPEISDDARTVESSAESDSTVTAPEEESTEQASTGEPDGNLSSDSDTATEQPGGGESDVSDGEEDATDTEQADAGAGDTAVSEEETDGTTLDEENNEGGAGDSDTTVENDNATTTDSATSTDDVATTTDDTAVPVLAEDTIVATEATGAYTFSEGDCTLVADGEFYCVASGPKRHADADQRVYVEQDTEGDREIYFFDGVETKRITNNTYDDFAPVFEEDTLRIVWQAHVNDRMQIMLYDIENDTTRQITMSHTNSSNPDIEGDLVVWQEWIDTNWEVMLADIEDTGAPFEIQRLTDNAVHDMFPAMYDGMVTWQQEKGSTWEIIIYDLRSGTTRALKKDGDTKYENPRFVLLFDSLHENGDVETIGYDLDSGEMMELGTRANREPLAPASPKDEVPDAPPQVASSTAQLKVGKEGDTADDDVS